MKTSLALGAALVLLSGPALAQYGDGAQNAGGPLTGSSPPRARRLGRAPWAAAPPGGRPRSGSSASARARVGRPAGARPEVRRRNAAPRRRPPPPPWLRPASAALPRARSPSVDHRPNRPGGMGQNGSSLLHGVSLLRE